MIYTQPLSCPPCFFMWSNTFSIHHHSKIWASLTMLEHAAAFWTTTLPSRKKGRKEGKRCDWRVKDVSEDLTFQTCSGDGKTTKERQNYDSQYWLCALRKGHPTVRVSRSGPHQRSLLLTSWTKLTETQKTETNVDLVGCQPCACLLGPCLLLSSLSLISVPPSQNPYGCEWKRKCLVLMIVVSLLRAWHLSQC
jgi:hypothetical protein